ncbi:hypothetical protein GIB67_002599 [Kingdonia uniflora]|uniref:Thioredoxin domain-containing protein n=1 Tax=Kingdonia uniflora TaxID=39325 RepID=A0A7J7KXG5_9MAGN|nr:hypothetical protein GIB67_002599 [Kingdonia uniflora]
MPLKIVDATLSTFDQVFEKFKSENKPKFILFLADKNPSTNLSWCPDCVDAEPVIYKKLEASSDDLELLRAYVGDSLHGGIPTTMEGGLEVQTKRSSNSCKVGKMTLSTAVSRIMKLILNPKRCPPQWKLICMLS